ncbi:hypothetical protein AOLI_G00253410 [Acnodon oligacanthus]
MHVLGENERASRWSPEEHQSWASFGLLHGTVDPLGFALPWFDQRIVCFSWVTKYLLGCLLLDLLFRPGLLAPVLWVLSFGLRNAPVTFQRLMNLDSGLEGCAVYGVFSDTWDALLLHIRVLFDCFVKATLAVNLEKCEFAKATVSDLGKAVGQGQAQLLQSKVEVIDPAPSPKKDLTRFLRMVGCYRAFCKNFSVVAAALTNLLRQQVNFATRGQCRPVFNACAHPKASVGVSEEEGFPPAFQDKQLE